MSQPDLKAEKRLIGVLLLGDAALYGIARGIVDEADFAESAHRAYFLAIGAEHESLSIPPPLGHKGECFDVRRVVRGARLASPHLACWPQLGAYGAALALQSEEGADAASVRGWAGRIAESARLWREADDVQRDLRACLMAGAEPTPYKRIKGELTTRGYARPAIDAALRIGLKRGTLSMERGEKGSLWQLKEAEGEGAA
jgi:hypothetical protein